MAKCLESIFPAQEVRLKSLEEMGVSFVVPKEIEQKRQDRFNMLQDKAAQMVEKNKLLPVGVVKQLVKPELSNITDNSPLILITWNIHYGILLEKIIEDLNAVTEKITNPCIVALQEVDDGCMRSNYKETLVEITKNIPLKYALFLSHWIEIDDEDTQKHLQDFPYSVRPTNNLVGRGGGTCGTAFLSNIPCTDVKYLPLSDERAGFVTGFNLDPKLDWAQKEPKFGKRASLQATFTLGNKDITLITTQLEAGGGMRQRAEQFAQLVEHASTSENPVIMLGDFNTLLEWPLKAMKQVFVTDDFSQYKGQWVKESTFWEKTFFTPTGGLINTSLNNYPTILQNPFPGYLTDICPLENGTVQGELWGPSDLQDRFHKIIMDIIYFGGRQIYSPKVDWIIADKRHFQPIESSKFIGNFGSSDHRPIGINVTLKDC